MPLSAHSQRQQLQEEEPIFAGVLNPRQSAQWIVENTEANFEAENGDGGIGIQIDQAAVEMVAEMICRSSLDELKRLDFAECEVHPKTADRAAIDWIFFMDSINFSFWSEEDKDHKWQVTHRGKTHSGYFAACVAVNRAMEIEEQQGIAPPLTSAQRMAQMTMEELERIFRGDNDTQIPMLTERLEVIRENGRILLEKFGGSFWNVLPLAHNAGYLLRLVVGHFPNFRDFAEYKGKKVSFLKRAQILVADVENCLRRTAADGGGNNSSTKMVDFSDLSCLTMFADYRVPQALAHLGVLRYSPALLAVIDPGKASSPLASGCPEEVQLRGFSIAACDMILAALHKNLQFLAATSTDLAQRLSRFCAVDVDIWLWLWRRDHAAEIDASVPFHRCRSIFY